MIDFFAALLGSLITLGSPVGYALDQVAADNFRSRLYLVEQLQVRVDNAPNYQVISGRIDRLRLASRGVWLTPEVRLEALEVETDPIDLDISRLSGGLGTSSLTNSSSPQSLLPPGLFRTPLQAGISVVITEADLQKALQTPRVQSLIQDIVGRFLGSEAVNRKITPQVRLLGSDRFQLQVEIASSTPENPTLKINLESGVKVLDGSRFQLVDPVLKINDNPFSSSVVTIVSSSLLDTFDLRKLESRGIVIRLLQLKIAPGQVRSAAFVSIN